MKKSPVFLFSVFFFIFFTGKTLSQGFENFDHLTDISSTRYVNGSFYGNNNILWNYEDARDAAAGITANHHVEIDLPAIMFRDTRGKIYSDSIPNGIGNFSLRLYKGFSSSGNRLVEVFVNGISVGQSVPFNDYEEHVFEIDNIDIEGKFVLEIRNKAGSQIIIDDIFWTDFGPPTHFPPTISHVNQSPGRFEVTPSDEVSVMAEIFSGYDISSASLKWRVNSGLYQSIPMTRESGNIFSASQNIPAQPEGSTISYYLEAEDDHEIPMTSRSEDFSYIVIDPIFLELPYFNGFRNMDDFNSSFDQGFVFEQVTQNESSGGYLRINNGSIISPPIDFRLMDAILAHFDATTFGGVSGQKLTVAVSIDNGASFTNLDSFLINTPGTEYATYAQYIDLRNVNSRFGRIKYQMTAGRNSIRFRDLNIEEFSGFIFDEEWIPSDPSANATSEDDIFIVKGYANFDSPVVAKDIYIAKDGSLSVENTLFLYGKRMLIEGDLTFLSSSESNGELGPLPEGFYIKGEAGTHRYFLNRQAYRMVSSPVTTDSPIRENWQEGVNNTSTDPGENQNPFPGFGTHITGNSLGEFGFDATESGEPSIFFWQNTDQNFQALENTDEITLKTGDSYLMFIRGDRGIDLTHPQESSETILRTKGKLQAGPLIKNFSLLPENGFMAFGNPYPSALDVKQLLTFNSENINISHYYVLDPNLADTGAVVTVNLADLNNFYNSPANQFLQPGQGAFLISLTEGSAKLNFEESHKAPGNHSATNKTHFFPNDDQLIIQLFTTENLNSEGPVHDSFGIIFDPYFNNDLTPADAIKLRNFGENIAVVNEGTLLSIERREMPRTGEVFQIFSDNYRHEDYTFLVKISGLECCILFLEDRYTGESTRLTDEVSYRFFIDEEPLSRDIHRFSIRVESTIGIDSQNYTDIKLFPNPMDSDTFYIFSSLLPGKEFEIQMTDFTGRVIHQNRLTMDTKGIEISSANILSSGVYFIQIRIGDRIHNFKLLKR